MKNDFAPKFFLPFRGQLSVILSRIVQLLSMDQTREPGLRCTVSNIVVDRSEGHVT